MKQDLRCPQCHNTSPPQPLGSTPVCLRTWLHTPKEAVPMTQEEER